MLNVWNEKLHFYVCCMNGTSVSEFDNKQIELCPICLRKLQYSIGFEPLERYKKMKNITKKFGGCFDAASKWYDNRINSI